MTTCKYCKGTGKVLLFTGEVKCLDCLVANPGSLILLPSPPSKILFRNSGIIQAKTTITFEILSRNGNFKCSAVYMLGLEVKDPRITSKLDIINIKINDKNQKFNSIINTNDNMPTSIFWDAFGSIPGNGLQITVNNNQNPSILYVALWGQEI